MRPLLDPGGLLLLARRPNYEAVQLSEAAGVLLLIFVVAVLSMFIAQGHRWRKLWSVQEDPRALGLFRILFGVCCTFSVLELWPQFEYLFTDEGIFSTDVAQQIRARKQFVGYGDGVGAGELWGFYDFEAFLEWLKGPNYSLLLFDGSPRFFWLHLWAFVVSMVMLIVGFQTRWVKWVAWFLFHSIVLRNTVYWEGTEHVYRSFFFYLALSRCGNAYSVDNWLRCRRLRAQKRLSEPGLPGEGGGAPPSDAHPQGLEAVYRRIPIWPRLLMILQIAAIYLETGVVKNGGVWVRGNAFYYALNLDHFYRVPPQGLSAILGTTVFRLNSWVVHIWECAFPLVVLGMVIRWAQREKLKPLSPRQLKICRVSALIAASAMGALIVHLMPAHTVEPTIRGFKLEMRYIKLAVAAATLGIGYSLYSSWHSMKTAPMKRRILGREFVFDQEWLLRWVLGRRLWLAVGLIFHLHLVMMMNIGWFNLGIGAAFVAYLNGEEVSMLLHRLTGWMRSKGLPLPGTTVARPLPPENRDLAHLKKDERSLPSACWWAALAVALIGIGIQAWTEPDFFGDLGDLYRNFGKVELGDAFARTGPVVYFNWFFLSIVAGLSMLALRISRGFSLRRWTLPAWVALCLAFGFAAAHALIPIRWMVISSLAVFLVGSSEKGEIEAPIAPAPAGSAWAYGPLGRTLCNLLCIYHIFAVAAWLLPDKQSFETFRAPTRNQAARWLGLTQTTQSWKMFAPNPPRSNMFLKVLVHHDGATTDMKTDMYACFDNPEDQETCDRTYPMPWILHTRQRKINRRIAGGTKSRDGWWQKWYARWFCKDWALNNDGKLPDKVELIKVWYPIASPEEAWNQGAYDPAARYKRFKKERVVYTANCKKDPTAQPHNDVRVRRGLAEVPEKEIHYWYKNRCRGWEKRRKQAAKARGETIDPKDPYFRICDSEKHREILKKRKARQARNN